jgi:hypothetical protein
MKINLINYELEIGIKDGILSKFARKMCDELSKLGHDVKITYAPDDESDVQHHINNIPYRQGHGINTLMVTHFLDGEYNRLKILNRGLETADMGICFSKDMVERLTKEGVNKDKLTYVLPAHDGLKRRPIVIAILTKCYSDGRKREWMLTELAKTLDKEKFAFRIMGQGWRLIVEDLAREGWQNLEYFEDFDYNIHKAILDSSDYLLYTGIEDEGAMSVLDAANAGLPIIAPVQGFHHEIGIEHPFSTQDELNEIFKKFSINRVEDWTWERYAKEHLAIWEKLNSK